MSKTLCKKDTEEVQEMKSKKEKYTCKKCGRKAHKEKNLCKPQKI